MVVMNTSTNSGSNSNSRYLLSIYFVPNICCKLYVLSNLHGLSSWCKMIMLEWGGAGIRN